MKSLNWLSVTKPKVHDIVNKTDALYCGLWSVNSFHNVLWLFQGTFWHCHPPCTKVG